MAKAYSIFADFYSDPPHSSFRLASSLLPRSSISPKSLHRVHEARNLFGCFCPEHLYDQPLQPVLLCRGVTLRENVKHRLEGIKQVDNEVSLDFIPHFKR